MHSVTESAVFITGSNRGIGRALVDEAPDPMSAAMADGWRGGVVKEFERRYATMGSAS
jgi:hypothetical protein